MKKKNFTNTVKKLVAEQQSNVDELLTHKDFKSNPKLELLRNAINNNKTVSVVFIKKDKTVRPMAIRKSLSSYVGSTAPKTKAQQNVEVNNDIVHVIDINAYIKILKETGNKELAAKNSWRNINLKTVLGFLVGGKFIDMREENNIRQQFGDDIYGSLTKNMVKAMDAEQNELNKQNTTMPQQSEENMMYENKKNIRIKESQLKAIIKKMILNEYDNYNYPAGADADPNAPWNQSDGPEILDYDLHGGDDGDTPGDYSVMFFAKNAHGWKRLDHMLKKIKAPQETWDYFNSALKQEPRPKDFDEKLTNVVDDYCNVEDIDWSYDEVDDPNDREYDHDREMDDRRERERTDMWEQKTPIRKNKGTRFMGENKKRSIKLTETQLKSVVNTLVEGHRPYSSYKDDPRWITAKYDGQTKDGDVIKKGDQILWFPKSREVYAGEKAQAIWAQFESDAADEYQYNQGR